jgi:hypothetical protein
MTLLQLGEEKIPPDENETTRAIISMSDAESSYPSTIFIEMSRGN